MRPLLHFTAEAGWINDPHGVTFRDGTYHLFHQHVPGSIVWAPGCHWGHATSTDLLTWTHHPDALAPGDGDDGIWTGSLAVGDGGARILYTSVALPDPSIGRVRVAAPVDDAWQEWTKGDVVAEAPADLDLVAFRDPFVVREGAGWRMFLGAGTRDGQALALTWTSGDLDTWTYAGVAAGRSTREREPVWTGSLWECPQLFEVDDHRVMLFSVWDDDVTHDTAYGIGPGTSYGRGRFAPSDWGRLSAGGSYYAPSFFRDSDGRPCVLLWMRGVAGERWTGCLSLPHVLSVRDGRLVAEPHPVVAAARTGTLAPGEHAAALDLAWTPPPAGGRLTLAGGSGPTAHVVVTGTDVVLERPGRDTWSVPWDGGPLRVVADGPALEVATGHGLIGGPVEPGTTWRPVEGECTAWSLARPQRPHGSCT